MSNRGSVLGGWGSGEARCRLSSHHPARPCFANPRPHCARLNTFLTTDADQDSAEPLAGKFKAGRATLRGLPDGHSDSTGVNWCAKAWFIIRSRGIPMDRHELARAVRNTYSHAMKAHHSTEEAISRCVAIVREHSPRGFRRGIWNGYALRRPSAVLSQQATGVRGGYASPSI